MFPLVIYAADIGSVARGRFGWASLRAGSDLATIITGTSIEALAERVAADLREGLPVALGFECPLFVPYPEDPRLLTGARPGEGSRPWCAGAGAGSLATGLTECLWVLGRVRELLQEATPPAFLSWPAFQTAQRDLFLWEAFVSQGPSDLAHTEAACQAVQAFAAALPDLDEANALSCERVHSLIGAALLRTGWTADLKVLSQPCIVIKP